MKYLCVTGKIVLLFGMIGFFIDPAVAEPCYRCPFGEMVESPKDCPDPAFLGLDLKPLESLPTRRVKEARAPEPIDTGSLCPAEMSIWREFETKVQKDGKDAFAAAIVIWSGNYSDRLQRAAIYRAKAVVRSTEDSENLNFLLACLEDVEDQKQKYMRLGKGNGLERKFAASRLALMASNPKLVDE